MFQRLLFISLSTVILSQVNTLHAQALEQELLPQEINSPYVEIRPLISGDGRELFFGRRGHPENQNGVKDLQDIWSVKRKGEKEWGDPVNPGKPLNNKFVNSLCTVSPDGQEFLVFNTYNKLEGPLARLRKLGEQWENPQEVVIENYYNHSEYLDFYQSYKHGVLLMALERDDTRGEQDLYISFPNEDGSWSKPLNLGAVINTKKSDFAPFLAADGKTLFYATYGLKGKGGADIFFTRRLDDSWTNWSKPMNVGAPINTSGEETYCSLTDDMLSIYYVSYRHGSEKRDIYHSPLPADLDQLGTELEKGSVVAINKNIKEATAGKVMEPNRGSEPKSEAVVDQTLKSTSVLENSTSATGGANSLGDSRANQTLTQKPSAGSRIQSSIKEAQVMNNQAAGGSGPLALEVDHRRVDSDVPDKAQYSIQRNVYFEFNEVNINQEVYEPLLKAFSKFLQENPTAQMKVVGHADELGTSNDNLAVSQLRAKAVKEYLVQQGISAERILVHFRGEAEPLASNDDDREGRELNRRVEFYVLVPEAVN